MVATYPFAAGRFLINSLCILENIDIHPVADRLLLNMIHYAEKFTRSQLEALPHNFHENLQTIGYIDWL
jgi:hypothetical protein